MATFEVDVDGVTYEVDAPNEQTAWLWANETHRQGQILPTESTFRNTSFKPVAIGQDGFEQALRDELRSRPLDASLAAAGTALTDLSEGAKQLVGMGNPQNLRNQEIIQEESPFSTFLGNAALYGAIGAVAPQANTLRGGGAIGAGGGLLSPTRDENIVKGKIQNTLLGGAFGASGQYGANKLANALSKQRQSLDLLRQQNASKDALQREVTNMGYTLPPSYAGGSLPSRILEGLSGKLKTGQLAQIKNQQVTNQAARDYLGVPRETSLDENLLERLREQYSEPYRQIAELPALMGKPSALYADVAGEPRTVNAINWYPGISTKPISKTGKETLNELKDVRFNAKNYYKNFNLTGNPESYQKAVQLDSQAKQLEDVIEEMAIRSKNDDLLSSLKEARKNIAKTYTIERAMQGTNVDAKELAKALDKGAMLEGDLLTSARFAQQYPDIARVPASGDANPMTALDWYGVGTTGGVSALAGGNPLLGFALPASRIVAREALLSRPVQRMMANKKYGIGPTKRLAEALTSSPYATIGFTGGALPAFTE